MASPFKLSDPPENAAEAFKEMEAMILDAVNMATMAHEILESSLRYDHPDLPSGYSALSRERADLVMFANIQALHYVEHVRDEWFHRMESLWPAKVP